MGLIWTILIGFVVGVLAKFLMPGNQNMGFILTTILGIAGSLVAGYVGQLFGWYQAGQSAGLIASVVFAFLILFIYGKIKKA
ncbi:GlsB/YeaQ/YmgE family stress response membrane protein [Stenoxybacter acetivorans]|uniref:GlsB/YeaQ/YmgE family stress response membrane protein n=1 Tax=Stenoxybacter acetivorans TaxID=422441 RepID=UPI00055BCC64|nr:GlsB/YeaQ/YmgE family stress response membrane protein [Stenoxybacter acetivorans]